MSVAAEKLWTIGALLNWTEDFFRKKGIESPKLDAQILLAHTLGYNRPQLYTRFDEATAPAAQSAFRELIRRRVEGVPVAYLVGIKEFYLLPFIVTPDVLIPRPATETLVGSVLEVLQPEAPAKILDLCTGSGCIAVTLAHHRPKAEVTATDVSNAALNIAKKNAKKHNVERIAFLQGDLFANLPAESQFDVIVANPPYIRSDDITGLSQEVRQEPKLALDGGPDGFAVSDRILTAAPGYLKAGGWLFVEIGADQESPMLTKLQAMPQFQSAKIIRDADGHARVAVARLAAVQ